MQPFDDPSLFADKTAASRRDFLRHASWGLGGILLGTSGLAGSPIGLEASNFGPANLEA